MSDSVTPWTVAHQAPLSMEFSRQEYWIGLHSPLHRIIFKITIDNNIRTLCDFSVSPHSFGNWRENSPTNSSHLPPCSLLLTFTHIPCFYQASHMSFSLFISMTVKNHWEPFTFSTYKIKNIYPDSLSCGWFFRTKILIRKSPTQL